MNDSQSHLVSGYIHYLPVTCWVGKTGKNHNECFIEGLLYSELGIEWILNRKRGRSFFTLRAASDDSTSLISARTNRHRWVVEDWRSMFTLTRSCRFIFEAYKRAYDYA